MARTHTESSGERSEWFDRSQHFKAEENRNDDIREDWKEKDAGDARDLVRCLSSGQCGADARRITRSAERAIEQNEYVRMHGGK